MDLDHIESYNFILFTVRIPWRPASYYMGHKRKVCGLRWSESGSQLASGGNDNLVHVWEASNTSKYLHRFDDHCAGVRALAWSPFKSRLLASGGGTADRSIKLWDTNLGGCISSIDTGAQVKSPMQFGNPCCFLSNHRLLP